MNMRIISSAPTLLLSVVMLSAAGTPVAAQRQRSFAYHVTEHLLPGVNLVGGDVVHVAFEIVDSAGTVVPTADNLVSFTATGGKTLLVDNANLADLDPYRSDRRRAFNSRGLAILSASRPGLLRLTANAEGLRPASLSVSVVRGAGPEAVPTAARP